MKPFERLEAPLAYLPMVNVDTDMIIPKQFLKTLKRTGLGKVLFFDMRYGEDGEKRDDFVLNESRYSGGCVLATGENFGCGSSREHAPWALNDFGIGCILAPSFADIFYNNCFKNGMLPIVKTDDEIREIVTSLEGVEGGRLVVDLEGLEISAWDGGGERLGVWSFDVEDSRRDALLEGLDDIGSTWTKREEIESFEFRNRKTLPWVYG
jgi:3-isopropylmalate/(R)-2-methylmalate dehydratase small subunit